MSQKIGSYAFLVGVIIAVIAGLVQALAPGMLIGAVGIVALVLVILGIVIGFLNIKDKHITDFLIATIAVAMIGLVALNPATAEAAAAVVTDPIVQIINSIVGNIVMLVAPAALIVGLKQIISLSKEQVRDGPLK